MSEYTQNIKPDIVYTSESGRIVEIVGIPSTETFAKFFKRMIDIRLAEQALEKVKEDEESNAHF